MAATTRSLPRHFAGDGTSPNTWPVRRVRGGSADGRHRRRERRRPPPPSAVVLVAVTVGERVRVVRRGQPSRLALLASEIAGAAAVVRLVAGQVVAHGVLVVGVRFGARCRCRRPRPPARSAGAFLRARRRRRRGAPCSARRSGGRRRGDRLDLLRRTGRRGFSGTGSVWMIDAAALAVLAGLAERLQQARADPLAGHLHQAERGDLGDLVLGPVPAQALGEPAQHQLAVATPAPCR